MKAFRVTEKAAIKMVISDKGRSGFSLKNKELPISSSFIALYAHWQNPNPAALPT